MQRLIARFLLLFATAGVLLPAVLQATAAPSHLCCRRMAQHQCHSYANTNRTSLRYMDQVALRTAAGRWSYRIGPIPNLSVLPLRQTITITGNVFT